MLYLELMVSFPREKGWENALPGLAEFFHDGKLVLISIRQEPSKSGYQMYTGGDRRQIIEETWAKEIGDTLRT